MYLTHLFTDEEKALREVIRKFTEKEIMPVREEMEEDRGLVDAILQKLVDLGIQKAGFPREYGGTGPAGAMICGLVCEELARGDAGIGLTTGINMGQLLMPAMMAENKAVMDRFIPPFCDEKLCYGSLSMTDSTGGADSENPLLKGKGITTRAKLDGDEWVINGTKSWPTNAQLASVLLTVCTTNPDLGEEGVALIYVPGDAPGVSYGQPEKKVGFRTSLNHSIFYDNVRVPKEYRLKGPGDDAKFFGAITAGTNWHTGILGLGIAQGAFEIALDYTKERKSGGKPVREWSLAAGILADMAIWIEMAKGALYNYAWMMDHPKEYGPPFTKQMISKVGILQNFAGDGAAWVTNKTIELMGSNGLSPEYHAEKYYRDAKIIQVVLAGQQVRKYRIARGYYDFTL